MGGRFYKNAFKALKMGSTNMDSLVVLGTSAAWFYGLYQLVIGYSLPDNFGDMQAAEQEQMLCELVHENAHNFETSSTLITVILLGKCLDAYSKKLTVDKLIGLCSLKPTKALLVNEASTVQEDPSECCNADEEGYRIDPELLVVGDVVKVSFGATVPCDGTVIKGQGHVNESMLTGEAKLIAKKEISRVFAGTRLMKGEILVRVDKLAENTAISQIVKLVEKAQSTKAPIQRVADTVASYFVPTIIALALVTWTFWFAVVYLDFLHVPLPASVTNRFAFSLNFGISTLVIACPCALGLATPTAVMVGTGIAASFGIIFKRADILEQTSEISCLLFDKTGTLTDGLLDIKDFVDVAAKFKQTPVGAVALDQVLSMLRACESKSKHPIAVAILGHL